MAYPGRGNIPWAATFRALRASGHHGWPTIEAFGQALKDLAAAEKVWRDFSETPELVTPTISVNLGDQAGYLRRCEGKRAEEDRPVLSIHDILRSLYRDPGRP